MAKSSFPEYTFDRSPENGITVATNLSFGLLKRCKLTDNELYEIADIIDTNILKEANRVRHEERIYLAEHTQTLDEELSKTIIPEAQPLISIIVKSLDTVVQIYTEAHLKNYDKAIQQIKERKIVRAAVNSLASTF